MFHLKDIRRRNVSSSPYLSSRALDSPSTAPNYDPINEHDIPAHIRNPTNGNIATSHEESEVEDVLAPGDIVGKGSLLKGDVVSLLPTYNDEDEDEQFQVIKELGKGSYAVVYLVHQVPRGASAPCSASSRGRSNSDSCEDGQILGHMDSEEPLTEPIHRPTKYGRKFAIKCLSKANLDKEELDVQMAEVTIHQSLPVHPNIVALHKTLQTSSYLLLVLEYVPGEDLFYFLQQARDHYPSFPPESLSQELHLQQQTPPTPSLLSSSHPSHLLSRSRLRLIASMFAQMCDAVATCHAAGVFHRDIKPENFIVTDGRYLNEGTDWLNGGKNKGRVVVKLTDFGLSTREEECSDMDCGSAPYMSYECRNNVAPTYSPREADVWSLGIVLINMLYHINPWTDTSHGACPSFTAFRQDPVGFFTKLFTGMTPDVAAVLAWRVFDVDGQTRVNGGVKEKMTAAELGVWVRSNLVDLLAMDEIPNSGVGGSVSGVNGGISTARVNGGHRLSLQMRISHLPVSRAPSPFGRLFGSCGGVGSSAGGAVPSPRLVSMALSRAPSLAPALEKEEVESDTTLQIQEEMEPEETGEQEQPSQQPEEETEQADATPSRTSTKRRRRGLRNKGKGAIPTAVAAKSLHQDQQQQQDETLKTLADASQSLVREISNVSKAPSVHQLHQQQPSSPSSLTPMISPSHVNGDINRISLSSTLSPGESGASGISETVLTAATTPSMMSTEAMGGTKTMDTTNPSFSISPSLKSSTDSSRTESNGSSLRTATMKSTMRLGGSRTKARPRKNYEPVSMYAVPSALLSKPLGAGGEGEGRTPSQLSTSSGSRSVAGSGSGTQSQPQEQQPKAVVKKPSKWTLRWKNNNSGSGSGGGNNAASTSVAATPSIPITPSPTQTIPTPANATVATPSASDLSSIRGHARRPRFIPSIGLPGHVTAFPTFPASSSASDAGSTQGQCHARSAPRELIPPIGLPGHVTFPTAPFSGSAAEVAPKSQRVMSPTASNVTNLIMGLNPTQQQFHLNESSGSLVGASGTGGYASTTPWKRGRRGKGGTGDSMAILSGAAVGGEISRYKSPSRSPGPAAPSFSSGFGSSASSSSVSLVSAVDLGQGQDPGWDWRDKRPLDRMGMESRGMGYSGVGGPGGSRGVSVRSSGGATGLGAGGGRHGSVVAGWGPFASSANAVFGTSGRWRASNAMGTSMSAMGSSMGGMNANASGSGGASLHGSVSASGTASPGASTIAFTRFSNSSVSTMATTISTGSGTANWRNGARAGAVAMTSSADADGGLGVGAAGTSVLGKTNSYAAANLPKGANTMAGFQGLNELPRGQQPNTEFGSPPVKKARTRNKKGNKSNNDTGPTATDTTPMVPTDASSSSKDLNPNNVTKLDTIIERPLAPDSPIGQQDDAAATTPTEDGPSSWKEASTSTTDLVAAANANAATSAATNGSLNDEGTGGRVKKVNKGQINTLAKMLSALRR